MEIPRKIYLDYSTGRSFFSERSNGSLIERIRIFVLIVKLTPADDRLRPETLIFAIHYSIE